MILFQLLSEELYPATAAGYSYDIATLTYGAVVHLDGFNEKLPVSTSRNAPKSISRLVHQRSLLISQLLLMIITKYMVDFPNLVTRNLFEVMRAHLTKQYYNSFVKPKKLATYCTHTAFIIMTMKFSK